MAKILSQYHRIFETHLEQYVVYEKERERAFFHSPFLWLELASIKS